MAPNWGPWAETGMAARGSSTDSLKAREVQFIPPKQGAVILKKLAADSRIGGDVLVAGRMGDFASEQPLPVDDTARALEERVEADAGSFSPRIHEFVLGERLGLSLTMDPKETAFLDHHRINGKAVLPGVATVALFAWAAELVQPNLQVLGLREVAFEKPVKFHRDRSLTLRIEITRTDEPSSDGLLFDACLKGTLPSPNPSLTPKDVTYHRARVVVGRKHPDSTGKDLVGEPPLPVAAQGPAPFRLNLMADQDCQEGRGDGCRG